MRVKDQNVVVKHVFKEKRSEARGRTQRLSRGHYEKLNASACCEFVQKYDGVRTDQTHAQSSSNLNDCIPTEKKALVLLK